jgi:glycosyltransferase involved in cell wall biosynthesis
MTTRICFIAPHIYGYFNAEYGYTGGGAERQLYLLSTALADRFDVHVVVGDYGQPERERRDGVTLHRTYPLRERQSAFQPAKHVALLFDAMQRANATLYIHRGRPRNAAISYLLTEVLGSDWVYHVANDSYLDGRPGSLATPLEWLYRRSLQHAASVVAQTTHQATLLEEDYGVTGEVIPNGYPPAMNPMPHEDREYVLWVGRLEKEQKRPHRFLDLAEEIPEETFRLVGPASDSSAYHRELTARAEALDNVEVYGPVPPMKIHEQYRNAKVLVTTSDYEGFPNTFLEAWRQETPVVSLDIDLSRFGGDEHCYAAGKLRRLEAVTRKLCADTEKRSALGRADRKRFEANFDIDTVAERYERKLKQALARP